jgi:hypothetical protein
MSDEFQIAVIRDMQREQDHLNSYVVRLERANSALQTQVDKLQAQLTACQDTVERQAYEARN